MPRHLGVGYMRRSYKLTGHSWAAEEQSLCHGRLGNYLDHWVRPLGFGMKSGCTTGSVYLRTSGDEENEHRQGKDYGPLLIQSLGLDQNQYRQRCYRNL